MSKHKKKSSGVAMLPNYSKYDYADKLPPFSEHERVPEKELSSLVCFHSHQPESKLSQFTDDVLNDHLYMTFCKKNLETPKLMCKLIVFFVRHYKKMLSKKAQEYLGSKKLTMDEWLNSVSMNRRGDILCLFLLSIVTSRHACVHLRNGRMWSTLRSVPLNHDEHVSMCNLHLVYLGFGAFLCLVPRPVLDIKEGDLPILGYVVGEDPKTQNELMGKAIKEEKIDEPKEPSIATAAAGSALQLPRVERELNMPPTIFLASRSTSTVEHTQASEKLLAICKLLRVNLIRLCKSEIKKYQCTNIKVKSSLTSCVQPCKVKIWKLPLRHDQSVQLKQFSQPD